MRNLTLFPASTLTTRERFPPSSVNPYPAVAQPSAAHVEFDSAMIRAPMTGPVDGCWTPHDAGGDMFILADTEILLASVRAICSPSIESPGQACSWPVVLPANRMAFRS